MLIICATMNCVLHKCVKTLFSHTRLSLRFRNVTVKNTYCIVVGQEQKLTIDNQAIHYLKVGSGEKTLLCFPGALGTIWSDFKPQIDQLNKDLFTVVAFDPPGYGFSRPPNREFTLDFYERDAVIAYKLMQELNITKFSLLGWSDGGIASLILAAKYPEAVEKLVVWGANSYILPEDIEAFEKIRDTQHWSEKARAPLVALYGDDGLQDMWSGWCNAMQAMHRRNGGNICMECVARITCPTLVLHGAKDPVVQPEHPNYLSSNIRHARMHIFPHGKHNIHLRYAQEFNAIVTDFILE